MNEIIKAMIEWITENEMTPDVYFYTVGGSNHLVLKLSKGDKRIAHDFYIPNGVLSTENWERGLCDIELNAFMKLAKRELNEADNRKGN